MEQPGGSWPNLSSRGTESTSKLSSPLSSSEPGSSKLPSESVSEQQNVDHKTRRIKAHRKTRQGCFNCKRRKVKCTEEKPSCTPCVRNGLRCVYPLSREASDPLSRQLQAPQAQAMAELHSGKLEYTALDMRLLHVFIVNAFPHLPLNCAPIWTHDVPAMAHSYPFLMHSILALAASHMVRKGDDMVTPAAHFHRLRAMKGVNEFMARMERSSSDDDALIAACYALAFQLTCIGDSPTGLWITMRTITVVNAEILQRHKNSKFGQYTTPEQHTEVMAMKLQDFPLLRQSLIDEAVAAVERLEPLCPDALEAQLYGLIIKTLKALKNSSLEGYIAFTMIYACVAIMPAADFARFSDPNEHVIQILHTYFMAIQTFMGPILSQEWSERKEFTPSDCTTARWASDLCNLPAKSPLSHLLEWPERLQASAREGSLWKDILEPGMQLSVGVLS